MTNILGICGGGVTLGFSSEACDGREEVQHPQRLACGLWLGTALAPAPRHHLRAHEKEDFSISLQRAAVLLLVRRGNGEIQSMSPQKF